MPKVAKGTRRWVEVAGAAWIDLLGYGDMWRAAGYDPTHPAADAALTRLHAFQAIIAKHSRAIYFPTCAMNDAGLAFRDLSPRARSVTFDFIARAYRLFNAVMEHDRAAGLPGARMVVATGFRVRNPPEVTEAAPDPRPFQRPCCNIIPELQGNFAFAKAFLADASGTKGGLPGPAFYVDMAFFQDPPPPWLDIVETVKWNAKGFSTAFGRISSIDLKLGNKMLQAGALDAFEIAERIAQSPNVIAALHGARLHGPQYDLKPAPKPARKGTARLVRPAERAG